MKDKGKPEAGKQYRLTGGPGAKSIYGGDTWQESEVGLDQLLAARREQASDSKLQQVVGRIIADACKPGGVSSTSICDLCGVGLGRDRVVVGGRTLCSAWCPDRGLN